MFNNTTTELLTFILKCELAQPRIRFDGTYGQQVVPISSLLSLIAVVGIAMNAGIVHLINSYPRFDIPSFFLIKLSCLNDVGVAISSAQSMLVTYLLGYFKSQVCSLYIVSLFILSYSHTMAIVHAGMISFDRYLAVIHPYLYTSYIAVDNKAYKILYCCCSSCVFVVYIACVVSLSDMFFQLTTGSLYSILLISTIFFYIVIRKEAAKGDRKYEEQVGKANIERQKGILPAKNDRHGAFATLAIGITSHLFDIPIAVMWFYSVMGNPVEDDADAVWMVLMWLTLLKTLTIVVRPLVYVGTLPTLRSKIRELLDNRKNNQISQSNGRSRSNEVDPIQLPQSEEFNGTRGYQHRNECLIVV